MVTGDQVSDEYYYTQHIAEKVVYFLNKYFKKQSIMSDTQWIELRNIFTEYLFGEIKSEDVHSIILNIPSKQSTVVDFSKLEGVCPFDIDEYIKNPNRKIITRFGNLVSSIKINSNDDEYPIDVTVISNKPGIKSYHYSLHANGCDDSEFDSEWDIFFDD